VACTGTVLVAIVAGAAEGEMAWSIALTSMALVSVGMYFSYQTRAGPPGWIKVLVAVAAVGALLWFFRQVSAGPVADITTVENPLTVLFAWILAVHSFHVPARRDLVFALAASAGLMAVAAAQAIDLRFGSYALVWSAFGIWSLVELWSASSGGARVSLIGLGSALFGVSVMAALIFLVLPAPTVAVRINFQSRAGAGGPVGTPSALAGDSGQATQLSHPGRPGGRTQVGGYLGFAGSLDTALRGKLSKTVVMRVRAQRPSYWVGETFDSWDGQSWTASKPATHPLGDGSPFSLPASTGNTYDGAMDLQTFYVASPTADLVFHAETATELWFPTSTVFFSNDGTIVSPIGLGHGAIYTVESAVSSPTAASLRQSFGGLSLGTVDRKRFTELPHPYPQAQALAESITASAPTTYDKVQALISWMGANTHYSLDIPPLAPGADTVNEFLFGDRTGFCEQISTSLAVMLRSLGIPAREAVGYVPGPYNPITDLYEVRAEDAHAWVQVWFPGHGWQSFDPTAVVPLANPAPGATALADLGHAVGRVPVVPVSALLVVAAATSAAIRRRRRRPATWAEKMAQRIERAGRRAGRPRHPSETMAEYAGALDARSPDRPAEWSRLASTVEASAYGGREPPADAQRDLLDATRRIRIDRSPAQGRSSRSG
jgi:hypothetical protein